jgi:sRNA-binding regulator protein Hfq
MEGRTPMVVVLADGELVYGTIEWYDKNCIKLHRNGEPNLLLFKHSIKYLYKQERIKKEAPKVELREPRDEELDTLELASEEDEEMAADEEDQEEEIIEDEE